MNKSLQLKDIRDDVLRKIGRNVVNLQKMEMMLKALVVSGGLHGNPSELLARKKELNKAVAKLPMGVLVDKLFDSIYSNDPPEKASVDLNEPWMSVAFRIETDEKSEKEFKKALSMVVAERNQLIHQQLSTFDANSIESCLEQSAALDAQIARIKSEYEVLESLVQALNGARAELVKYLNSEISRIDQNMDDGP